MRIDVSGHGIPDTRFERLGFRSPGHTQKAGTPWQSRSFRRGNHARMCWFGSQRRHGTKACTCSGIGRMVATTQAAPARHTSGTWSQATLANAGDSFHTVAASTTRPSWRRWDGSKDRQHQRQNHRQSRRRVAPVTGTVRIRPRSLMAGRCDSRTSPASAATASVKQKPPRRLCGVSRLTLQAYTPLHRCSAFQVERKQPFENPVLRGLSRIVGPAVGHPDVTVERRVHIRQPAVALIESESYMRVIQICLKSKDLE